MICKRTDMSILMRSLKFVDAEVWLDVTMWTPKVAKLWTTAVRSLISNWLTTASRSSEMSSDPLLHGYGGVNPPPPYGTTNQHYYGHSRRSCVHVSYLHPRVIHPQYLNRTVVIRQRSHCRFFKTLTVAILVWILFGSLLRHLWHSRYKYSSRPHVRYIVLSTRLSSVNFGNSGVSSLVTQTWTIRCHMV